MLGKFLVFGEENIETLLNKLEKKQNFFLNAKAEVAQGIVSPQDFLNRAGAEALNNILPIGTGIFNLTEKEKIALNVSTQETKLLKPFFTTDELKKYFGYNKNKLWIIYTNSEFKNRNTINIYPNLKRHLDLFEPIITSDNKPYGLHRSRDEYFFKDEKIISLRKCVKPTFTYTDFDCYVSQTFFVIKSNRINQKYLTAILNSTVVAFWLKNKGKMQGNLYQVDKEPIMTIPIFNTDNKTQKEAIVKNVDTLLQLHKEKQTQTLQIKIDQLQNRIDYCEQRINEIIYELYELTPEEINIIEQNN